MKITGPAPSAVVPAGVMLASEVLKTMLLVVTLGAPRLIVLISPARSGTSLVSLAVSIWLARRPPRPMRSPYGELVVTRFGTPLVMMLISPARSGESVDSLAPEA